MKRIGIVPTLAKCAVVCAVLIVGACEPYVCVNGTLDSASDSDSIFKAKTHVTCVTPYICTNGTAAPGDSLDPYTERCESCALQYVITESQACQPALTPVGSVTDGGGLELLGARSVATAVVGGVTYLFVAAYGDVGINVFSVGNGGALTSVASVSDQADMELDGASSVATAVVGDATYLFVAGYDDDGVSVFSVGGSGALTSVHNVTDDATLELDGASSVTTATIGKTTYLFVAGFEDDGVSVFSVGADGALTSVDNVDDDDDARFVFKNTRFVTTTVMGDVTYLFVTGAYEYFVTDAYEHGVTVFSVGTDGKLEYATRILDIEDRNLRVPYSVNIRTMGDVTYLFVAGYEDDGVSVFSFSAGGDGAGVALTPVQDVPNAANLLLNGASSVTSAVVGSATYLFVTGYNDAAINLFSVGADGMLTLVSTLSDDANLQLRGATSVATASVGGSTYLFVAGRLDSGISVFLVAQ